MLQYHTLTFFLVTVASSLAFSEARSIRRNLNTNSNFNQIHGGFNGQQLVPPQVFIPGGTNLGSIRDRQIYVPQIINHKPEYEDYESEDLTMEGSEHYPGIIDKNFHPDNDISDEEHDEDFNPGICDHDNTLYNRNPIGRGRLYPSNAESENGQLGLELYPVGGEIFWGNNINSNANTNFVGPKYRRNNYWGSLKEPYVDNSRLRPVYPIKEVASEPIYVTEVEDPSLWDITEFTTTPSPLIDEGLHRWDDFPRGHLGSNVNTNTNVNVVHGRRNNANTNSNTNMIGYGGYGSKRKSEIGREIPSQYLPVRRPAPIAPKAGSYYDRRRRPNGFPNIGDESDYIPINGADEDESDENVGFGVPGSSRNANVNTNSNVNIVARRNNPRHRRSVEHEPKKSIATGKLDKDATAKVVTEGPSTTNGPKL